jgi:hypothetical protein
LQEGDLGNRCVVDREDRELVELAAVDEAGGERRKAGLVGHGGEREQLGIEDVDGDSVDVRAAP